MSVEKDIDTSTSCSTPEQDVVARVNVVVDEGVKWAITSISSTVCIVEALLLVASAGEYGERKDFGMEMGGKGKFVSWAVVTGDMERAWVVSCMPVRWEQVLVLIVPA